MARSLSFQTPSHHHVPHAKKWILPSQGLLLRRRASRRCSLFPPIRSQQLGNLNGYLKKGSMRVLGPPASSSKGQPHDKMSKRDDLIKATESKCKSEIDVGAGHLRVLDLARSGPAVSKDDSKLPLGTVQASSQVQANEPFYVSDVGA